MSQEKILTETGVRGKGLNSIKKLFCGKCMQLQAHTPSFILRTKFLMIVGFCDDFKCLSFFGIFLLQKGLSPCLRNSEIIN